MLTYSELILLNHDIIQNVETLLNLTDQTIGIEFMMDGKAWDAYKGDYTSLIKQLRAYDVPYSVHPPAWDTNLTAQMESLRVSAFDLHKKAIDFASEIAASYVVVHPGFLGSPAFDKEEAQSTALEQMSALAAHGKKHNVKLAMENVGYHGQSIYNETEFFDHLANLPDNTYYLIDTGHAHLNGWDIPALIKKTGERLIALHLHDNNGKSDEHLPIGHGTVDWEPIFASIKELYDEGLKPELVLEFAPMTPLAELTRCHRLIADTYGISV